MSVDTINAVQLAPYDDEEEIQLMDMDGNNLQLEEQFIEPSENVVEKKDEEETIEQEEKRPSILVIEKLKVYIRDGPNSHHVENILVDDKYYELPTADQLASIELNEDKFKDILESLNLTKEDFRNSTSPTGSSRPESLYVHGVNNMSTQEILNYFEEFEPIGIEWISDRSCNIFWYDMLTPIKLLSIKTVPGPCISRQRPVNSDHSMGSSKRKASAISKDDDEDENSSAIDLSPGHWREGNFQLIDKPETSTKFYLRYTTLDDRKSRGAENRSEYYRQYGNPNYNNMTGLISRSKKRALNAMKSNRFRDFTVVKSNDSTSASSSVVEDATTTTAAASEDNTADSKVKFTVILPPKKNSPDKEDEDEDGHRSKRQRRRSRDAADGDDEQQRKDKTHFTVTIDSPSKLSKNKSNETSKSTKDNDDDESTSVTDARQILERKRRNRK